MNNHEDEIENLLERAKKLLPEGAKQQHDPHQVGLGSIEHLNAFLHHSEFELAVDELIALGELNFPNNSYWQDILTAATLMKLHSQSETCRQKLGLKPT